MVISTVMKMKNSTAEFMSLTLTMITLNLYDERYFMTEWNCVIPQFLKYTNKKIAPLEKKCNYYLIKIYDYDTTEKSGFDSKIYNYIICRQLSHTKYLSLSDCDKIWNRNKNKILEDKLLKDFKNENKIEVKPRYQRKYLFEPTKQNQKQFKRKNISFKPQRFQIKRNNY